MDLIHVQQKLWWWKNEITKNISFPTHELTVGCKFEKLKKNRFIEIDFQYPLPEKKKSFNYPNTKSDKVLVKNEKALEVSESSDEEFALKDSSELDSIATVTTPQAFYALVLPLWLS